MEQHQHCLLCHSPRIRPLKEEYAHAFLVRCEDCGLVFGRRIPSEEELRIHYSGYRRNNPLSPVTIKRYEELLAQFEPYRKSGRILDVGCGDGYFLDVAKKAGWEVYGSEFTDEAVSLCRAKGIHMHQGRIQEYKPGMDFDVITSFEVLEHINDGEEHVTHLYRLLRPGGLFYFTTPNFNSMSRRWLGGKWNIIEYPEHLVYYTPATVTRLLKNAGFRRKKLITTGFSPQRFKISAGTAATPGNSDEQLRQKIEGKSWLRLVKKLLNAALSFTRSGDTLKGYFVRP